MPSALPKSQPLAHPVATPSDARDEVMANPLHPMHRELLARFAAPPIIADQLDRPKRMAIIFYAAIGAWGLVWCAYKAVALMV